MMTISMSLALFGHVESMGGKIHLDKDKRRIMAEEVHSENLDIYGAIM
jgi:hypothetical protein